MAGPTMTEAPLYVSDGGGTQSDRVEWARTPSLWRRHLQLRAMRLREPLWDLRRLSQYSR